VVDIWLDALLMVDCKYLEKKQFWYMDIDRLNWIQFGSRPT
jgi:hypothetical protein